MPSGRSRKDCPTNLGRPGAAAHTKPLNSENRKVFDNERSFALDLTMSFRSFKLFFAGLLTVLLLACGNGEPAPAPTGLATSVGESSVTLTWDMSSGVEYWVFYAPTSVAPSSVASMQSWFGLPGGNVLLKVSSPYVVQGLTNGVDYTFSINGRTGGGPGGAGSTPITATPRIAGSNWTQATALGSNDLRSVAYGSTTTTAIVNSVTTTTTLTTNYVAVGTNGAMYSSTDGTAWSAINYTTSKRLNGASFFSSYKVVGDGGLVLTSTDTVTWTAQTSGTTQNLYAITSNNLSLNVAVGAGGTIITSADGITWKAASNSATTQDLYAVNYNSGDGLWVAVGAGGTIVISVDGLTWQNVSSGETMDLHGVASITSVSTTGVVTSAFVAVGDGNTVLSSTDGATWTAQTAPGIPANLNAVVYGTQFVAVGTDSTILYSTDGLTWTVANAPANGENLLAVAHGQNGYVAVGTVGTNLQSK